MPAKNKVILLWYQIVERSAFTRDKLSLEAFLWDNQNLYCIPVPKAKSVSNLNTEGQKEEASIRSFKYTSASERQTDGEGPRRGETSVSSPNIWV